MGSQARHTQESSAPPTTFFTESFSGASHKRRLQGFDTLRLRLATFVHPPVASLLLHTPPLSPSPAKAGVQMESRNAPCPENKSAPFSRETMV